MTLDAVGLPFFSLYLFQQLQWSQTAGTARIWRNPHPYLSEAGGYPGWGFGAIGSDMVDLDFAQFSLIVTPHSIFMEHNKMLAICPRTYNSRG